MEHSKSKYSRITRILAKSYRRNFLSYGRSYHLGYKLILLFLFFSQLNVNSQSCNIMPSPISGSASIAACELTTNTTIQSGDVLSIDLIGGRQYTFEVCYNAKYDQPDVEYPQIQLWTDASASSPIAEANGDATNCAIISYNSCADETVLLQAFSHSCISDWKKWDLNITSNCCVLTCGEAVHISASSPTCTAESLTVSTPSFTSICTPSNLAYTTDLPVPPTGVATPPSITVPAGNPVGTYEIIWEIRDCVGAIKTCTQDIIIDPVLACDDLVTINLTGPKAEVTLAMVLEGVAPICYSEYELKVFYQGISLNNIICCEQIGEMITYTVTHKATGLHCGGEISVEDKFAPILTCKDVAIKCSSSIDPDSIGYPDLQENCDTMVSLTYFDEDENYNCADPTYIGRIKRTWIATDATGLSNTCVQNIDILRANLAGVVIPADITIECKDIVSNMVPPNEPLFCGMPISHYCNLVSLTKDDTTFICENSYKIFRKWTVLDWCSGQEKNQNQIIEVVDQTGPILVCPEDLTVGTEVDINCSGTVTLPAIVSARDVCSSNTTVEPSWEFGVGFGPFSNVPVGVYPVDYIVSDDCGNSSVCSIEVTIEDDDSPTAICDLFTQISIPATGTAEICAEDIDTGSRDNCGVQNIALALMSDSIFTTCLTFDCLDAGMTEMVIFRVYDDVGLFNDCMVEVEIVDKVAPSLTCPADVSIDCLADETNTVLTGIPQAFDACLDTIYFEDNNQLTDCRTGNIFRTWFAVDNFGNISNCVQTITLVNNMLPDIIFGSDTTLICETVSDDFGRPSVIDNCGIYSFGRKDDFLIDDVCQQKILRTWTVLNECTGEDTSAVILIKLFNDTTLPQFSGAPEEIRVSCEDPIPDFIDPIIADECDDDLTIEVCMGIGSRPVCENEGTRFKIWKVTDNCGNFAQFRQEIIVVDESPPVFSNIPSVVNLNCDDIIPVFNPTVTDNCDSDIEVVFEENQIAGDCSANVRIERTYTASDDCGNSTVLTQVINVTDNEPPVFTSFPTDLTLDCNDVVPNIVPEFEDNCDDQVMLSLEEEIIASQACVDERQIIRTFQIEDDCGNIQTRIWNILVLDNSAPVIDLANFNPNPVIRCDQPLPPLSIIVNDNCDDNPVVVINIDSSGTVCERIITRNIIATDRCGNSAEIRQIITAVDNIPPSTLFRPPFLIESDTTICITNIQLQPIIFEDNCDDDLNVFFEIDYNSDGFIFDAGLDFNDTLIIGTNASGNYPIGNHMVTYTATDICGNSSVETLRIEVTERKFPLIGCVSNEFFIGVDGTVSVNTSQVINPAVTFDECTPIDVQFADDFFGTNLLGHDLIFDCDDTGLNLAFVVAIDSFGNTSACLNQIEISDPNGNCGSKPDDGFIVAGRITNEEMTPIANVTLTFGLNDQRTTQSGNHGLYHFLEVEGGDNCQVIPEYDVNYLEGITTFDLVLIQKHIIGSTPLNSPYKQIAADVNQSGTISTLDLIQLRQLILYQITGFQNNQSWRFVPTDYIFTDPSNPFLDNFPEKHTCFGIQNSELNVNFIAVKIGDVNCTASSPFQNTPSNKRRTEPMVHLELGNEKLEAGKIYNIPIRSSTEMTIEALQFSLQLDEALDLEGISISQELSKCVHMDRSKNLVHFAWTSFDAMQSDLFYLKVKAKETISVLDHIAFSSIHIKATAFDKTGNAFEIGIRENEKIINEIFEMEMSSTGLEISQNMPNPFRNETQISVNTDHEEEIIFSVFNSKGQSVYKKLIQLNVGENSILFNRKNLSSGIYFFKVSTSKEEITKKMMILDF